MDSTPAAQVFEQFVAIVQALRTPVTGCPWDLEQDHESLKPYLIEEAHEVVDAIDQENDAHLQEELGDLLLQVVLHAQVAQDRNAFSIVEVIRGIAEKMIRRHPHVFGNSRVSGSAEVLKNWEAIKAAEKGSGAGHPVARVPDSLPALHRAQRLGEKAARSGMTEELAGRDLLQEKLDCLREGKSAGDLGAFLFEAAQFARSLGLSAEEALRAYNRKFVKTFNEPKSH